MYIEGLSASSLLREQLARGRLAVCQLLWLFLQRPTCSFSICGSSTVPFCWTRVSAAPSEENPQTRNEIFICMKMDDKLKAAGERGAADQRSTTSSGNRCSRDLTFADSFGSSTRSPADVCSSGEQEVSQCTTFKSCQKYSGLKKKKQLNGQNKCELSD